MSQALNPGLLSKFRGCMIGSLIGDCLGGPFEGDSRISKKVLGNYFKNLFSGESIQVFPFTDDTCMTLSVANSLVENGKVDPNDLAKKFVSEYYRQPKRGYGENVVNVFRALKDSDFEDVFLPAKLQFNGSGSYGNGSAMRIAPMALFGNKKNDEFLKNATEQCSRLTHTHPNGCNGAILQCFAVHAALKCDSAKDLDPVTFVKQLEERMKHIETKSAFQEKQAMHSKGFREGDQTLIRTWKQKMRMFSENESPFCESLDKIKNIYLKKQEDISAAEIAEYLGNNVSAHKSIPTALYSFLRGMKPIPDFECSNPFARTIYFAISVGGDTDTIASMAGSIAGAFYGVEGIPVELQRCCEAIDAVRKLAEKLHDVAEKDSP